MSHHVALYARVSTTDQHLEPQLFALRQYATARELDVAAEYVDHGVSGAKERRPALDRLLTDARRRRFDVLAITKLDRLARSVHHLTGLGRELEALGIDLVVLDQSIDTSTPAGRSPRRSEGSMTPGRRRTVLLIGRLVAVAATCAFAIFFVVEIAPLLQSAESLERLVLSNPVYTPIDRAAADMARNHTGPVPGKAINVGDIEVSLLVEVRAEVTAVDQGQGKRRYPIAPIHGPPSTRPLHIIFHFPFDASAACRRRIVLSSCGRRGSRGRCAFSRVATEKLSVDCGVYWGKVPQPRSTRYALLHPSPRLETTDCWRASWVVHQLYAQLFDCATGT
jgi:hypothetical protein